MSGWMQVVRDKGGRIREVPVPEVAVQALRHRLRRAGRQDDPTHPDNRTVPLLFRLQKTLNGGPGRPAGTSGYVHAERSAKVRTIRGFWSA